MINNFWQILAQSNFNQTEYGVVPTLYGVTPAEPDGGDYLYYIDMFWKGLVFVILPAVIIFYLVKKYKKK